MSDVIQEGKRTKQPVLFVGHGSPLNAIEQNPYTQTWSKFGEALPRPSAILGISAHWYTKGTRITDADKPKQIYDMYGFPKELYQLTYEPDGNPNLAETVKKILYPDIEIDREWGLDHGLWAVLCKMYPQADIPVVSLSIDRDKTPEEHFKIGKALAVLREQGVMIIASGNIVHHLGLVNWSMQGGYPFADDFDQFIIDHVKKRQFSSVLNWNEAGKSATDAFPTPEHFLPLLYALGASNDTDEITVFNESRTLGAISMTGFCFG